jgi:sarcosine oxidase, subunit gamma
MMLSLRGASESFFAACEAVLGVRPPTTPNTVASAGERAMLWLGPDEWLFVSRGEERDTVANLRSALAGVHSALVDVSSSRKLLVVSGEHAEAVMAKAATLDFSVGAFPVGSCAQTNVARTQGIIHRRAAEEFAIYVRASCEPYLRAWLANAEQD